MKRIAEQIADWLAEHGIEQVFMVTGGGAMFLNHALANHPRLRCTYMHHEQACAMAAEGYARVTGKPAVVNVTTGPGGINALNGVFGAYTDSIPMLILSGQVKRETCLEYTQVPGLRQLGDQEAPVVAMAAPVTKWSASIGTAEQAGEMVPRALALATSDRPGPVWLDVPIDVQSQEALVQFQPLPSFVANTIDVSALDGLIDLLQHAHRPVLMAGTGVRLSGAQDLLLNLAERYGIPVCTAWTHDLIASDHPLFAGRPGTIGTRAGNFAVQNADLVIVIGSRLNIRQVSYNWAGFATSASVVQVDIDPAELIKPVVKPQLAIHADAADFLRQLTARLEKASLPDYRAWALWCQGLRQRYPGISEAQRSGDVLNPYVAIEALFEALRDDDIIVCGNASACIVPFQVGSLRAGQRLFSNSGSASMGYDLPAAIGAAVAAPNRRIICIAGDGSLQMNVQELQTLQTLGLNVIVVVLANNGYLSIRQTHENFFGRTFGATPQSGVDFPDYVALSHAYGLPAEQIDGASALIRLRDAMRLNGPCLLNLEVDPTQNFEPRIKSRLREDGRFETPALDDMFPFIPSDELAAVRTEAAALRHWKDTE